MIYTSRKPLMALKVTRSLLLGGMILLYRTRHSDLIDFLLEGMTLIVNYSFVDKTIGKLDKTLMKSLMKSLEESTLVEESTSLT